MAGLRSVLLPIILVASAIFLTRSPFMMASTAPDGTTPWADEPIKLIVTPQYQTKKTDIFTSGATHMALLHNSVFRGFNSIYLQARYVKDADKPDFVRYCLTWHKFVMSHHDDEEKELFPKIEALLGDKAIFEETHKEHQSFLGGLGEFEKYLNNLHNASDFAGAALVRIMHAFQAPFEQHFHHEIATIAALADHPKAPQNGTDEHTRARDTFKFWGKTTVSKAGVTDVVPIFMLNLDRTAEKGLWADWPPMPAPVRWGLVNVAGAWHSARWKFAACDADGRPRELYALSGVYGAKP